MVILGVRLSRMNALEILHAEVAKREAEVARREAEVVKREAEVARREAELRGVPERLDALAALVSKVVEQNTIKDPLVGFTSTLAPRVIRTRDTVRARAWQRATRELLADGGSHALKDLAAAAHSATPEVDVERIRKGLFVWLQRQIQKKEIVRTDRGEYRLVQVARVN